jgi:hypothetical protein
MKILLLLSFSIVWLNVSGQQHKKHLDYKNVRTILTDINDDGKADTIIISSSLGSPGLFNKVSILLAGFTKRVFTARDMWTDLDETFLRTNKNAVNSKSLFLKKTAKHTVILLFGVLDGAGYRGEFSIINIENNSIKMVFDHTSEDIDVEVPKTLTDLEHYDRLCFVYNSIGERAGYDVKTNSDIGTYTPYFVYPVTDTCKLNKPLTKKYNQENYVFAGFEYNDKLRVLYPRGKGKLRMYKK